MHDHDERPAGVTAPAGRDRPGAEDRTGLIALQAAAGNASVVALLQRRAALAVQRDDDPDPVAPPSCAGPSMAVDPSGIGQALDDGSGAQQVTTQQLAVQQLPVQRDGGGGAAVTPAAVPTVSWNDFADASEDNEFAAQSGWDFGFSGGFTVTMSSDPGRMWAKPSAKADQTHGAALLRHEQYHFRLAGVMAGKATAAQGSRLTTQADFDRLMAATNRESNRYDAETDHGLRAAQQATWEGRIDAGSVRFP